ncbi:MAG: hypothetical protein ACOCXH_01485 [Cyclobacteriaceae bacterium]
MVVEIKVGPALDQKELVTGYHIQIENRPARLDQVTHLVLQLKRLFRNIYRSK